jgi:cell fate regulator YaaT (PSP1 superfamily)
MAYDMVDSVSTPTSSGADEVSFGRAREELALSHSCTVRFVVVQFKHELCTYQGSFRVAEGDYVVVEADRGEHVGRVHRVLDDAPAFHVPSRILRRATETEVALISETRGREASAAARIQDMVHELHLPLRIVDAEIYTDGSKMTVFFAAKGHVDFRQLQRNLFREFHRRIWLINYAEVQYRNRNFRNRK